MKIWMILLVIMILLTQGTWIFLDARRRGESYYWLWGLFGLLNFPTSLIVYLLVMGYRKRRCPSCGREIQRGQPGCAHCGSAGGGFCPRCQAAVSGEWNYCPYCACELK